MTGDLNTPGIMYLILEDLFNQIVLDVDKHYDIRVSYVEIYNEVITNNYRYGVSIMNDLGESIQISKSEK